MATCLQLATKMTLIPAPAAESTPEQSQQCGVSMFPKLTVRGSSQKYPANTLSVSQPVTASLNLMADDIGCAGSQLTAKLSDPPFRVIEPVHVPELYVINVRCLFAERQLCRS